MFHSAVYIANHSPFSYFAIATAYSFDFRKVFIIYAVNIIIILCFVKFTHASYLRQRPNMVLEHQWTSAWMVIKESRPPFTSTTTKNTMVGYHSVFLNSFTCLRDVPVREHAWSRRGRTCLLIGASLPF